jgi:hypothetical protein
VAATRVEHWVWSRRDLRALARLHAWRQDDDLLRWLESL